MKRRHFTTGLLLPLLPSAALASPLPDAQLKILVGFPAGGGTDALARQVAEYASQIYGRTVAVLNQTGASGLISAEALRRSPADGATIGLAAMSTAVIYVLASRRTDIDYSTAFQPVIHVVKYALAISASKSSGIENWQDFVAWAKKSGNKALYGHAATGSIAHLLGEMLKEPIGADLQHVPFKGGGDLVNNLTGGHISVGINNASEVTAQHNAGRLRVIAVSSSERAPGLPDVPTLGELGYPALVCEPWAALFAPVDTPQPALLEWNRVANRAVEDPKVRERFASLGFIPTGGTPPQLAKILTDDLARYRTIIERLNFTIT